MKKLTKKKVSEISNNLYKVHGDCVQVNIMDLSKIIGPVEKLLSETGDLEQAEKLMMENIAKYRMN